MGEQEEFRAEVNAAIRSAYAAGFKGEIADSPQVLKLLEEYVDDDDSTLDVETMENIIEEEDLKVIEDK